MERNGSFNIPNKKYYTGGVKGNGNATGFTTKTGTNYWAGDFQNSVLNIQRIGTDMSQNQSLTLMASIYYLTFGLVEDSTKTGIIVEPDTQISMIIKY